MIWNFECRRLDLEGRLVHLSPLPQIRNPKSAIRNRKGFHARS